MAQFELGDASDLKQNWRNIIPGDSIPKAVENPDGCFDCNICLDTAHDPVVTLCGHLFCWPCIYQWLHLQISSDPDKQKCPVCKADVSSTSLVPLYGSGPHSSRSKSRRPNLQGVGVPRRPAACGLNTLITTTTTAASSPPNPRQSQRILHDPHPYYGGYSAASAGLGDVRLSSGFSPMVGMLGKMVYSSIFGGSDTISLFSYPYRNSYADLMMGGRSSSSGRIMQRLEMQASQSLDRVSFFLFCFFVFCFLLF
ncbi:E3 ubiquitin-protein ligase RMA3-like [Malania oleifera]|uniref:E3 ubiquitin-protein ligase RMA3-like n=1 Tax=Malania oleifera TaxID=397392 RepID=UPI0025ADE315|nr:E3 ubiquitin-protein ligase RMA3-like [Malania oleifera]